ncbi:MAG: tyrosine--tRNA ligase [Patescibacteria group bacterium]
MVNDERIQELLTRGVAEVIYDDALRTKLTTGKPLRIKFGVDPTSPNIHLGRATALLKLRDFQNLGHQIVFIIGDFTGVIGDTSDKESERPMLSRETVEQNLTTYFEQAGKILDMSKVEEHRNTEWLEKLQYREICDHADTFSLSDFIARDNIKRRLDAGKRISLRELLYPLMQGYDSVAVRADVEIGGTDQKFNMLAGRKLQERAGMVPQNIITLEILEGLDGRKMSSSWGNTINLNDTPADMFGKVMSLQDQLMMDYFKFATRIPIVRVEEIQAELNAGANPRDIKMLLGEEIVKMFYGEDRAKHARAQFVATFQDRALPDDIEEVTAKEGESFADILVRSKTVASKTEWRRLVGEGAVKELDDEGAETKIEDPAILFSADITLKVGKRRFIKIKKD